MNKNKETKTKAPAKNQLTLGQINYTAGTTLYVSGLKYSLKAGGIKDIFKKYGKVIYVNIVLNKETGLNRGIAFVQMEDADSAKKAISELNEQIYQGRTLKVSIAKEQAKVRARTVNIQARKAALKEEKAEKETAAANIPPKKMKRKRDKGLKILFNHLNS